MERKIPCSACYEWWLLYKRRAKSRPASTLRLLDDKRRWRNAIRRLRNVRLSGRKDQPPHFRALVMDSFGGSQDPHIHLQAFQTQVFISEGMMPSVFTTNRAKKIEVADLFEIKQVKGESLKNYLTRFNSVMIQVNNPNQIFFVKAFLRVGQFNDSLALRLLASMGEIKAWTKKHMEADKEPIDQLQAKREVPSFLKADPRQAEKAHMSTVLRGLVQIPPYAQTLDGIEKLIRSGHLSCFVQTRSDAEAEGFQARGCNHLGIDRVKLHGEERPRVGNRDKSQDKSQGRGRQGAWTTPPIGAP
ncbi:hypothetical protein CR513_37136, partial [Mucuna pruriens]